MINVREFRNQLMSRTILDAPISEIHSRRVMGLENRDGGVVLLMSKPKHNDSPTAQGILDIVNKSLLSDEIGLNMIVSAEGLDSKGELFAISKYAVSGSGKYNQLWYAALGDEKLK